MMPRAFPGERLYMVAEQPPPLESMAYEAFRQRRRVVYVSNATDALIRDITVPGGWNHRDFDAVYRFLRRHGYALNTERQVWMRMGGEGTEQN